MNTTTATIRTMIVDDEVLARQNVEALLRHAVPEEVTKRRAIEVLDELRANAADDPRWKVLPHALGAADEEVAGVGGLGAGAGRTAFRRGRKRRRLVHPVAVVVAVDRCGRQIAHPSQLGCCNLRADRLQHRVAVTRCHRGQQMRGLP